MGIFDDAIRQHLDLKRRQGADEAELQQLEDEAFGLPARPGDPDFPETGEEAAEGAEPQAPAAPAEAEPASQNGETEATGEALVEEPPVAEPEDRDETPPHGDPLTPEPEAEPPAEVDAPVEDSGAPDFSTTEREAIADQPTEFFDQSPEPFELGELELELDEELEDVGRLGRDDEANEVAEPGTADVEAHDQEVEHPLAPEPEAVPEPEPIPEPDADAEPETGDEPEVESGDAPEPETGDEQEVLDAEADAEEASSEAEGEPSESEVEDVLEETPEFLRDNPDDDELWFEQGQPKDFDF